MAHSLELLGMQLWYWRCFLLSDRRNAIVSYIQVIWYGGQMMGEAVSNALTGAVSPSGRSPFTWPTGAKPRNASMALEYLPLVIDST